MNWNMNKTVTAVALPLIAVSSLVSAATKNGGPACAPTAPASCNPAECNNSYCLGPENYGVNAPVRPHTCNGDFVVEIDGFYWNAHQDGMEYAIETQVDPSVDGATRQNLIGGTYQNPDFKWDFGFRAGVGYNSGCDGWDLSILWTWYRGKASSHVEAEADDNRTLLPLWSTFPNNGMIVSDDLPLYATDIETQWKLNLNLIDLDLGREFWVSRKVSLRPHVGLRIAYLKQGFQIKQKGGAYAAVENPVHDYVDIDNNFKGVGIRGGFDTVWNLGCGFGLYGNMALSIIYGRFTVDHDEYLRETSSPFSKTVILDTTDSFRASRLVTDLELGVQWARLICSCQYGLTVSLGWEQHLFLDQNQMWRVNCIQDQSSNFVNVYGQGRGDLDTQGWTLKLRFEF